MFDKEWKQSTVAQEESISEVHEINVASTGFISSDL